MKLDSTISKLLEASLEEVVDVAVAEEVAGADGAPMVEDQAHVDGTDRIGVKPTRTITVREDLHGKVSVATKSTEAKSLKHQRTFLLPQLSKPSTSKLN